MSTDIVLKKIRNDSCRQLHLPGFSIVEISIALVIIGILTGLAFKSLHLIEVARLRAIPQQVEEIRTAVALFVDRHGVLPGGEGVHAGSTSQASSQSHEIWKKLAEAGLYPDGRKGGDSVKAKIGGAFSFVKDPRVDSETLSGLWISLSRGGQGGLTPQQAQDIDLAMDDGHPKEGSVRSAGGHHCVKNNQYEVSHKDRSCALFFRLED